MKKKQKDHYKHGGPHNKKRDHKNEEGSEQSVVSLGHTVLVDFRISCTADHPLPDFLCDLEDLGVADYNTQSWYQEVQNYE